MRPPIALKFSVWPSVEKVCPHLMYALLSVTSLWRQSMQTVWDEPDQSITYKAIKQWCTCLRSLRRGQRWPLWAQTFQRLVQNDRLHECFTICKKICQVLTILHQLICKGVANFGTRCRNRPHNRQLPERSSRLIDLIFITRMLYRNMYWLLYRYISFYCILLHLF